MHFSIYKKTLNFKIPSSVNFAVVKQIDTMKYLSPIHQMRPEIQIEQTETITCPNKLSRFEKMILEVNMRL